MEKLILRERTVVFGYCVVRDIVLFAWALHTKSCFPIQNHVFPRISHGTTALACTRRMRASLPYLEVIINSSQSRPPSTQVDRLVQCSARRRRTPKSEHASEHLERARAQSMPVCGSGVPFYYYCRFYTQFYVLRPYPAYNRIPQHLCCLLRCIWILFFYFKMLAQRTDRL